MIKQVARGGDSKAVLYESRVLDSLFYVTIPVYMKLTRPFERLTISQCKVMLTTAPYMTFRIEQPSNNRVACLGCSIEVDMEVGRSICELIDLTFSLGTTPPCSA